MVEVRKIDYAELQALVPLVKGGYHEHAIFSKTDADVIQYFTQKYKVFHAHPEEGAIFIAELNNEIIGTCTLTQEEKNESGHTRWKLHNLAVAFKDMGCEAALIENCLKYTRDMIAQGQASSAKMEAYLAPDKEKEKIYATVGFVKEGILHDHYREDEDITIFGMVLKKEKR